VPSSRPVLPPSAASDRMKECSLVLEVRASSLAALSSSVKAEADSGCNLEGVFFRFEDISLEGRKKMLEIRDWDEFIVMNGF
jgi:hypothetical protein